MNTSITKSRLKELVKEVMVEESEYQAFFAKALEKAGKSINDMSDEEKKAFFNKVDKAWNGKSEKKENTSEMTGTGAVGGYNTPAAFSKNPAQAKKTAKRLASMTGYDVVDEAGQKTCPHCGLTTEMCECGYGMTTEARDANGNEFPEMDDVKAAVKKMIQNNDVERILRNKVIAYLQKEKGFTGAGNTNSSRLYDKVINDLLKH